jgi:hypothetical protein
MTDGVAVVNEFIWRYWPSFAFGVLLPLTNVWRREGSGEALGFTLFTLAVFGVVYVVAIGITCIVLSK